MLSSYRLTCLNIFLDKLAYSRVKLNKCKMHTNALCKIRFGRFTAFIRTKVVGFVYVFIDINGFVMGMPYWYIQCDP
jgi:hypothetical protein